MLPPAEISTLPPSASKLAPAVILILPESLWEVPVLIFIEPPVAAIVSTLPDVPVDRAMLPVVPCGSALAIVRI
jgi:hypothetical protein